jgi:predicted GNAT family acetyltransferase
MQVTRHPTADSFLNAARPLLMAAEAENNLILGVSEGLARNPEAAGDAYLATVSDGHDVLACAAYVSPFKLMLTRANREPIAALAQDAYTAVPEVDGITGPHRSAGDFAAVWSTLSGVQPRIGMRMRIHEARMVAPSALPQAVGAIRPANQGDLDLLTSWTDLFVTDANIPEKFDSGAIVADGIKRGRLYVWDDDGPKSMAAWAGKTPNGVRINFVYTPRELRGKGYATACVSALTRQQMEQGSTFCWLYTDLASGASSNIFKRIGYRPVSDVTEYYLRGGSLERVPLVP